MVKDGAARTRRGLMCALCWGRCARLSCAGGWSQAQLSYSRGGLDFFSPATFENAPPENSGLSDLGAFESVKVDFRSFAKFQVRFSDFRSDFRYDFSILPEIPLPET